MLSGPISGSDLFCLRPSERFWINLQARYDLEVEKDWLGAALDDIQPCRGLTPELDCHASLTSKLQVSHHLWLPVRDRPTPVLTPPSGM